MHVLKIATSGKELLLFFMEFLLHVIIITALICAHVPLCLQQYLWQTVRSGLKDDQKNPDWYCNLLQLQIVSHSGPAQHATHTVLGGYSYLVQAYGQAIYFGR